MDIYEYEAKSLFKEYGIPILEGYPATSLSEVLSAAKKIGQGPWVLKAQVKAGGRGKAGGVIMCHTTEALEEGCEKLLNKPLVTHQTKASGEVVSTLYVEKACDIEKELYLSLILNRKTESIMVISSVHGGIDIEKSARKNATAILRTEIDPLLGIKPFYSREILFGLGLDFSFYASLNHLLSNLYNLYTKLDSTLLEINPLVITKEKEFIALDAKLSFDENALFRHPSLSLLKSRSDFSQKDGNEEALNYVKLEGTIGCMVNGAGLAMATMDIINYYGGKPANFLDIGGNADSKRVKEAFSLILSDSQVKSILINIFGGIVRCDMVAMGILKAIELISVSIPIVVRLEGTNKEEGKKLLQSAQNIKIITADTLDEAALKAVEIS